MAPKGVQHWTDHINNNLIPVLNLDYNKNYSNFSSTVTANTTALFSHADPRKKEYYTSIAKVLPNNINVKWNFSLDSVIINAHHGFTINGTSNENLFRNVHIQSPDTKLNLVIVPSTQILGLSVFPLLIVINQIQLKSILI